MRSVCLKVFFNNFHFAFLDSSTIAQDEAVREIGEIDAAAITTEVESIGSKRNSAHTEWSDKDRYLIGKYTSENAVAATVRKFERKFPNLNESTVIFPKKSQSRVDKGFKEKKRTIQSNREIFVTNRTPFNTRTTQFSASKLLDCTKSARLCNQHKYSKCNCLCINSKISTSCRKYCFGVSSLGSQSFQTDGIHKALKNFIKIRNSWGSKEGNRVLFPHEIVT